MKNNAWLVYLSIAVLSFSIGFSINQEESKLNPAIDCKSTAAQCDSLIKTKNDLVKKIDILNRYLVMKHLEYVESCELLSVKK